MSFIEGIGDEVIQFFIGLIVFFIGVVAWWSTRIFVPPTIRTVRTVLVLETRLRANQQRNQLRMERISETDQRDYIQDLSVSVPPNEGEMVTEENKPVAGTSNENRAESGDFNTATNPESNDQQNIIDQMDSENNVLRRRRLEFFENKQEIVADNPSEYVETSTTSVNNTENSTESENNTNLNENDIRIKLKYINDDLKLVNGKLQEQLGDFKRRHFEVELTNNYVRLIFNGQVLDRDDLTLQSCGLFDNCVVHCLIHKKRQQNRTEHTTVNSNLGSNSQRNISRENRSIGNNRPNGHQGREWDLGNLFFVIVSFVLGAAWYLRYEYPQFCTGTATVALVGLTGIFTVLVVAIYFPDPDPAVQTVHS